MRPRRYLKKIEVWRYGSQEDGFSGAIATDGEKLCDTWANLRWITAEKQLQYGLETVRQAAILTLRQRNDLDYNEPGIYFMYEGRELVPQSVTEKGNWELEILVNGIDGKRA